MANELASPEANPLAPAQRACSAGERAPDANLAWLREQKLEAIGQLAGGIAHDLNDLLTIVLGNLELVKRRFGDTPGLVERVDAALGASTRAAELTRRLLGTSQLQPMRLAAVDVGALVTELAAQLRRTWGDTLVVETDVEHDIEPVHTDASQLETALVNLCSNARDAMSPGCCLRLSVRRLVVPDGTRGAEASLEPGAYARVEVRDDGRGMEPDVLARAFEPFFTTREMGAGAGLGLSIVHGFAKRARGALDLRSAPGEGTTATLFLRLSGSSLPATAPAPAEGRAAAPRRATVLVVEDDQDIREFAVEILRDAGYEICEAADGRAALAIVRSAQPIDLLLTDLLLPGGVNGREVATEARSRRRGIPVLYASGYAPDALLDNGRLEHRDSFIAKPYSAHALLRSVADAVERDERS